MTYKLKFRLPSATQWAFAEAEVEAESIDELMAKVQQVTAIAREAGLAESAMNDAFKAGEHGAPPSHDDAVSLVQRELGGTTIEELEQVASHPAAPWEVQGAAQRTLEAASNVAPAPWQNVGAAPVAPKPWERPAMPPSKPEPARSESYNGPYIRLPYLDAEDSQTIEERKRAMGRFYGDFKNSLRFDPETRSYKFHHTPDERTTAELMRFMAAWGGEFVQP